MSTKLVNLRRVGRYINPETNRPVNVHQGRKQGYGVDILFYYNKFVKQYISDREFYHSWVKIS